METTDLAFQLHTVHQIKKNRLQRSFELKKGYEDECATQIKSKLHFEINNLYKNSE